MITIDDTLDTAPRRRLRCKRLELLAGTAALLAMFTANALAEPVVQSRPIVAELFQDTTVLLHIREFGLAGGGPAPIFVNDAVITGATGTGPIQPDLPPNLSITRVGNACLQLSWSAQNGDPGFQFPLTLIAGDGSTGTGTVVVEQGGPNTQPPTVSCDIDPANSAPQASPVSVSTLEGAAVDIDPFSAGSVADGDGLDTVRFTDPACWAGTVNPQQGTVTVVPAQNPSGQQLRFTPAPGFSGPATFEYCVTDNPFGATTAPAEARAVVTVDVRSLNDITPVDDNVTTAIGEPVVIDVLANDPENLGISSVDGAMAQGTVELLDATTCGGLINIATECVRYTPPPPDANGVGLEAPQMFTYTASNDGVPFASATVTVQFQASGETPMTTADAATATTAQPVLIDVLANDTDDGGVGGLSIVDVSDPANGTATIAVGPNDQDVIRYVSDPDFAGTETITYTVSDNDPNTPNRTGNVSVTVTQPAQLAALEPLALSATQRSVAGAIDTVCPQLINAQETGELSAGAQQLLTRCSALISFAENTENVGDIRDALQDIAGEEVLAQGTTGTRVLNTQVRNIGARLAALRAGARGISGQGLAINLQGKGLPVAGLLQQRGGGASADEEENALLTDSRLGIFVSGRLNFGEQDTTLDEEGYDFDTYGATLGVDYRFRNDLVLGASLGYADATVDFNFDGGDLETQGLSYTVYGTWYSDAWYLDALVGTGTSDFDTQRVLRFQDATTDGVDTVALGSTDADQTLASISVGYNFERGGWVFAPYLSYDYLDTEVDGYSESGGQGWELAFDAQDIRSEVLTGGLRLAYNRTTDFGVFVPHLRVAFQTELEDAARVTTVRFANDPFDTEFQFVEQPPDSDFFRVGAGFSMVLQNGVSGFVDYESLQGYNNISSTTLTLGLRFERRFR